MPQRSDEEWLKWLNTSAGVAGLLENDELPEDSAVWDVLDDAAAVDLGWVARTVRAELIAEFRAWLEQNGLPTQSDYKETILLGDFDEVFKP